MACSSEAPSTTSKVVLPPSGAVDPVAPSAPPSGNALVYFDGTVDAVRGEMNLVVRAPSGQITSQATLPYGTAAGDVYFHTCSSKYDSSTHQLSGAVQAVNLMSGTVTGMNAVIDSISTTGVTLASGSGAGGTSGIIGSYGSVVVNTANCDASQPWAFQNLSNDPSFTFKGHADGTAPSGGGGQTVIHITEPMITGGGSENCLAQADKYAGCGSGSGFAFTWTDATNTAPSAITVEVAPAWTCDGSASATTVSFNGTSVGSISIGPSACTCSFDTSFTQTLTLPSVAAFKPGATNTFTFGDSSLCRGFWVIGGTGTEYGTVTLN